MTEINFQRDELLVASSNAFESSRHSRTEVLRSQNLIPHAPELDLNLVGEILKSIRGFGSSETVLTVLARYGQMTVAELAGATNRDFHEVDHLVDRLGSLGLLHRDGDDEHSLVSLPEDQL